MREQQILEQGLSFSDNEYSFRSTQEEVVPKRSVKSAIATTRSTTTKKSAIIEHQKSTTAIIRQKGQTPSAQPKTYSRFQSRKLITTTISP